MARIGRYQIVSELGRGAMGVVYRARDPKIGRELAVKTIRLADHADSEELVSLRQRLFREAQSAGRLSHPGIVTVFDADEEDGMAYFTMELVEGQKLSDYPVGDLRSGTKLAFVTDLLNMAGSALDYAHARGVVHRDIKPSNIMVTASGVKIMDFGVARVASSQLTRTGTVVGTPNYMSPEQVRGETVGGQSDQFSLAVIVYEILTGRRPFQAPNLTSTLFKLVNDTPTSIRHFDSHVSPELEAVVMRALAKNPAGRYESCTGFASAFEAAARRGEPSAATPVAPQFQPVRPDSRPIPRQSDSPESVPVRIHEGPTYGQLPQPLAQEGRVLPPGTGAGTASYERFDRPRPSRWPSVIFVLLLCAIGALSVLVVRYPGLIEDPRGLLEMILGLEQTDTSAAGIPEGDTGDGGYPALDSENTVPPSAASEPMEDGPPPEAVPGDPSATHERGTTALIEQTEASPPTDVRPLEASVTPDAPEREATPPPAPQSQPRFAAVYFTSPVEGVSVIVDSNRSWRCITPCRLSKIPLGIHTVVANLSGYGLQRRTIDVGEHGLTLDVRLEPVEATLFVRSVPPDAQVFLNGRDTGERTNARMDLKPGRYEIRLVKGDLQARRTIEVVDGELQHIEFRLGTN